MQGPSQHTFPDSRANFLARLDENTWYYDKESVEKRINDLKTHYKEYYGGKLQQLESSLNDKGLKPNQYHEAYRESEKLRASQQERLKEMVGLQQIQQVRQEHSSSPSQIQLQDNFEQSEIVQDLKDLSRDVDHLSHPTSAHLVDNRVQEIFGRDAAELTSLDARDLPGLKILLRHPDRKSSLVASSRGVGMNVERFLHCSICTLICAFLITRVFQPFHPGVSSSKSETLLETYEVL